MSFPALPRPPRDPLREVRVVCSRDCGRLVGLLGQQETRDGRAEVWSLFGPTGGALGHRAELACERHGSCGTWKATTLGGRARAELARWQVLSGPLPVPPVVVEIP